MISFSKIYNFFYFQKRGITDSVSKLFSYRHVVFYFIGVVILNLLVWWAAYFIYTHISGDLLFLHYNVKFGIDLIGATSKIFLYPTLGSVLLLVDFIMLMLVLKNKSFKFISYINLSFLTLVQILLLIVMLSLYLINFR